MKGKKTFTYVWSYNQIKYSLLEAWKYVLLSRSDLQDSDITDTALNIIIRHPHLSLCQISHHAFFTLPWKWRSQCCDAESKASTTCGRKIKLLSWPVKTTSYEKSEKKQSKNRAVIVFFCGILTSACHSKTSGNSQLMEKKKKQGKMQNCEASTTLHQPYLHL